MQSLNLNDMGLKHLLLINIVFLLLSILTGITLGGEGLSGKLRCLDFWLRGIEDVSRFYYGNRSCFYSKNLAKQTAP